MGILDLVENNREEMRGKRIEGIVLGVVADNKDPDGLGRVKIRFPWLDDGYQSTWAPVATLMAGKERGAFFLPEVNDEVIVAFDQGDIDHPYVIGALWSIKNKPPESNSDFKNNIRKIKSRSGHEIILNDDQNKGNIEIKTKAGHNILLDDSSGKEKMEIKDKSGNSISMDSTKNSINISSQMKLSIKAKDITIESDGTMNIKAGATLTIKGSLVQIN